MLTFKFQGPSHRVQLRIAEFSDSVQVIILPTDAAPTLAYGRSGTVVYAGESVRKAWKVVTGLVKGAKAPPRLKRRLSV